MIQLLPHKDLYAIKVPLDAYNFNAYNNLEPFPFIDYWIPRDLSSQLRNIIMPDGHWQILGEVTKDSISFDPSSFVHSMIHNEIRSYENYDDKYSSNFMDSEKSFVSLLKLHGIHFVNPFGEEPRYDMFIMTDKGLIPNEDYFRFREKLKRWQHYKDNLVEKVLIIQKL